MNNSTNLKDTQLAEKQGAPQSPTSNQQRSRGNQNSRRRNNQIITTNAQSYQGECEDIGYIMRLRSEKFDKKVQFQVFLEKLGIYIVSHLKDGGDIQPLYAILSDPNIDFAAKHNPIKPKSGEGGEIDEVDHEIYREEVKQFVQRKINLRRNIEKVYGLIWVQCSAGLQTYIKGLSYYEIGSSNFDALWLLREIKKATSSINDKANPYVSLHNAISQLY